MSAEERLLAISKQLGELQRIATGICESVTEIAEGAVEVVDDKRFALAIQMLRACDHELGRAIR